MNRIAKAINGITSASGGAIGVIPTLLNNLKKLPADIVKGFAGSAGAKRGISSLPVVEKPKPAITKTAREKALEKLEKDAAKRAKELALLTGKQTKALKDQAALKKAGTLFDLDQTSIIAALKGKITDEDRKRLELQLALITGNTTEASKLAGEIGKAQGLSKDLIAYLKDLPDANNPFKAWAAYLDAIEAQVRRIASSGTGGAGITGNVPTTPGMTPGTNIFTVPSTGPTAAQSVLPQFNVRLVLDGKEIASSVSNYQTNDSLSGTQVPINRRTGSFATP
jgi:hypothetical protein